MVTFALVSTAILILLMWLLRPKTSYSCDVMGFDILFNLIQFGMRYGVLFVIYLIAWIFYLASTR